MSDIIRLLPDAVANQIAAGEVIQRPASVVKELVENSIDAGASEIHVLVTDAGKTCIQVVDNGQGMSETDARLSFERHATSKIRQAQDLFALHTMGFRGEALASIAAVAEVDLKTRQAGEELGTRLQIAGSKVESQEVVSCAEGCNFSVKNLFFNVPARRKFLKSNSTELSNVLAEFERIALVHPDVAFYLYSNDSELFNLPATTVRQRIMGVFGKKINQQLLPVEVSTSMVTISGFVGKPESARKKGNHQYFFVNGRYMRHPYFHKAVLDAYERLIPVGEQISYFLYFEVDPAHIDVNIHPTKTEIKFENEQSIWQILAAAVKETLGRFNEVPTIDFDTEDRPEQMPSYEDKPSWATPPEVHYNSHYNPFDTSSSRQNKASSFEALYGPIPQRGVSSAESLFPDEPTSLPSSEPDNSWEMVDTAAAAPQLPFESQKESAESTSGSGLYQFKGRYILTSVKSGLMLIDQHRAHVRVLFDRYMEQIRQGKGYSQGVLFPEIIQLPPSEAALLEALSDDFAAVGFELSSLGGGSYAIQGVPAGIEGLQPVELVRSMVTHAMEKGSDVKEEIQEQLALTLARASAIVYGQVLTSAEMSSLIDDLFATSTPSFTPDGRTVLTTLRDEEIEKLFNKA